MIILYLILLLLSTQLGKHFWPSFSYISGIRIDYLSPTIYLTDILAGILFVLWIFTSQKFSIFNFQFSIKSQKLNFKNLIVVILNLFQNLYKCRPRTKFGMTWLTILLLGIIFSKNPPAGFYGLLKLGEFIFFGFYISQKINKITFLNIVYIFSFGIIVESLLAIAQFFHLGSIGGLLYFLGERTFTSQTPGIANASINGELILRPYGTFPHPNVLAGYLTIAMAMVISKIKDQKSKIKNIISIIALILGSTALFLTMSRVAIVIWLVIIGYHAYKFSIKSKCFNFKNLDIKNSLKIKNFKLKIIALVLIGSILIFSPLRFRFFESSFVEESTVLRAQLIQNSILMIKDHPIFGVGINNFLTVLPSYISLKTNAFFQQLQPVHNIFLLIAAQTGIVGFAFFLWFVIKTWQKLKSQNSNLKTLLLIILILGMFDHYFLTLQQGQLLMAFTFGLLWARGRIDL